jgi:hypothetical protein
MNTLQKAMELFNGFWTESPQSSVSLWNYWDGFQNSLQGTQQELKVWYILWVYGTAIAVQDLVSGCDSLSITALSNERIELSVVQVLLDELVCWGRWRSHWMENLYVWGKQFKLKLTFFQLFSVFLYLQILHCEKGSQNLFLFINLDLSYSLLEKIGS